MMNDKKSVVIKIKRAKTHHFIPFQSIPFVVLAMESHIGSKSFSPRHWERRKRWCKIVAKKKT
jgi:predicted membrane chloride channel (bestrophin family)